MKLTIQSHNILAAARHLQILGQIFGNDCVNPYSTFEILLKAEKEANRKATDYCNGLIDGDKFEAWKDKFLFRLKNKLMIDKLPSGFILNTDPRGYALKMAEGTFPDGMWRDFGGYGILAPEF